MTFPKGSPEKTGPRMPYSPSGLLLIPRGTLWGRGEGERSLGSSGWVGQDQGVGRLPVCSVPVGKNRALENLADRLQTRETIGQLVCV